MVEIDTVATYFGLASALWGTDSSITLSKTGLSQPEWPPFQNV